MISAREAISLPCAQLKPSDAEAAATILANVDTYVRRNMDRGGCLVPIDPTQLNGAIATEILRVCRACGWRAEWRSKEEPSALTGQTVIIAFNLSLEPTPEAYDDVAVPFPGSNGVASEMCS